MRVPPGPSLTATGPVRILIADHHQIFRHGLRRLLETEAEFTIVGETRVGASVATLARDTAADVLLLGMTATQSAAVDALRDVSEAGLSVRTILLADRVDTPHVRSALQFGVRAVVPKDSSPDMLFTTIRSVMQAEATTGPDHVRAAVESWQRLAASRRRSRSFGLTPREIEILRAVLAGRTNREIAEESRITENTVKTHLGHMFDKLGASNRLELALFAAHHRVLDGS